MGRFGLNLSEGLSLTARRHPRQIKKRLPLCPLRATAQQRAPMGPKMRRHRRPAPVITRILRTRSYRPHGQGDRISKMPEIASTQRQRHKTKG